MPEYRFAPIGTPQPTLFLNQGPVPDFLTVPITGHPRGGTTMVAAVVHALGVYLGPQQDLETYHFEDQTMHLGDMGQVYPCIASRNAEHAKWGWKDPPGMDAMYNLLFSLRNPRMIIVFRDILATVQGEMRIDKEFAVNSPRSFEFLTEIFMSRQHRILQYVNKTAQPTLLVSYEKAKEMPDAFISNICEFLGLSPSAEQLADARSRIGTGYIQF